jgi:hypothetical protein
MSRQYPSGIDKAVFENAIEALEKAVESYPSFVTFETPKTNFYQ